MQRKQLLDIQKSGFEANKFVLGVNDLSHYSRLSKIFKSRVKTILRMARYFKDDEKSASSGKSVCCLIQRIDNYIVKYFVLHSEIFLADSSLTQQCLSTIDRETTDN